ncbi:hypothetical protein [Streptomyces collinus]|uniref:hypothetical protein n=1 Tax=Streptomyces collinus TaxID=42684 RepID=UPI0033F1A61F
MTSTSPEVEPAPVFVDQTGLRGRRLRGLGWLLGIVCTGFVVAMIFGLVGAQSQAPGLTVPHTANTTPPSQYLNAPLPAAPGIAQAGKGTTTATAALPDATASAPAGTTAVTAVPSTVTAPAVTPDATASAPAATAAGTGASSPVTAPAQ